MPDGAVLGPLTTDRLLLRPSRVEDAATFRRLWTERDPRVPAHRRIGADGRPTVQDIAARIAGVDPGRGGPRLLTVTRRPDDFAIGYCGLNPSEGGPADVAELAYELLQAVHGHGYATEAAAAVVVWATEAGFRRLEAGVWSWNTASRRVLAKLGFTEVGRETPEAGHDSLLRTVREPTRG